MPSVEKQKEQHICLLPPPPLLATVIADVQTMQRKGVKK